MTRATTAQVADQLLRTDEVAAWLSVSKSTLVRWRQSGEGPAVYWLAEGVPRYRAADVEAWLAARQAAQPRLPRRGSAHAGASRG
ncbi:AlpA family transcriptional regulator [Microbacterium sp. 18062]|uniref:helix-turn-helix transcriptional regulator n=1 Tax=Microbacterium sp. 18062 TaxID=2681410 RepID=UPI001356E967|nr:helix-turn-helix domain-containing protein [Microbacterium sp. 18062]